MFYSHVWRDFGIFWAYVLFNFAVVFVASWLYLQGFRQIAAYLSPRARKEKKIRKAQENEQSIEGEKA